MMIIILKRIFRAIKYIPFFIKEVIAEKGESCRICGRVYYQSWSASDELWKFINGKEGGCMCPLCFERIKKKKMSVTSYSRGHLIFYDGQNWRYVDTGEIDLDQRPCASCGNFPTKEGYDFCLGHIPGVSSACCGHGIMEKTIIRRKHEKL